MRLTCPNCDAQYEVPDDVVPPEGRDVQCSNCGQTWFQHHPDNLPVEDKEELDAGPPAPDEETAPPPEPEHPEEPEIDLTEDAPEESAEEDTEDAETAPRKELDPAVADILRQEAEAERELRRQQASDPLESQPDLGLDGADDTDEAERSKAEARQRMARMRGEPEPMSDADVTAAAISSRRDLLPDIEEINSTLRSESERTGGADGQVEIEAPTAKRQRRSFRRGFLLVLLLFVLLALIYVFAPQIALRAPGMDPYLSAYVAWVDSLRLWLDGYVQGALRWLDETASQSGG